ncbi:MAG: hypothetical protein AB7G88_15650, partial [Thermomicrobiales bacterium]
MMSQTAYRGVVITALFLFVIGGLGYGALVELDRSLVSQGPEWERQAVEDADLGRAFGAARLMFICTVGVLIAAIFYGWSEGSSRGRLLVVALISLLVMSWFLVATWAG